MRASLTRVRTLQLRCFARKMSQTMSHHDPSRKTVSSTAYFAAQMRSLENDSDRHLFEDPYAKLLAGDVGSSWYATKSVEDAEYTKYLQAVFTFRTFHIDKLVSDSLQQGVVQQVCVLGAGLDARPWRMHGKKSVDYFEVDFLEIFNYKLPIIETLNKKSEFTYHSVSADLSLPEWPSVLLSSGFNSAKPALWLIEGLSMYLTVDEISKFLQTIAQLSAPGGVLIADFISSEGLNVVGTSSFAHMFRFTPDNPIEFLSQFGWNSSGTSITRIANDLGLAEMIPKAYHSRLSKYIISRNCL